MLQNFVLDDEQSVRRSLIVLSYTIWIERNISIYGEMSDTSQMAQRLEEALHDFVVGNLDCRNLVHDCHKWEASEKS